MNHSLAQVKMVAASSTAYLTTLSWSRHGKRFPWMAFDPWTPRSKRTFEESKRPVGAQSWLRLTVAIEYVLLRVIDDMPSQRSELRSDLSLTHDCATISARLILEAFCRRQPNEGRSAKAGDKQCAYVCNLDHIHAPHRELVHLHQDQNFLLCTSPHQHCQTVKPVLLFPEAVACCKASLPHGSSLA